MCAFDVGTVLLESASGGAKIMARKQGSATDLSKETNPTSA
jgi:hypothetical protein